LGGLVISEEKIPKTFDGKKYTVQRIGVSDGQTTFFITKNINDGEPEDWHDVRVFGKIRFKVDYAKFDKGVFSVGGEIIEMEGAAA
jgi:hypothetical protein